MRREDHPPGGRRRLIVLTDKALAHMEAAGAILHQLESEIVARAGGDTLLALRTELARLIRASTGDSDIPPLRPCGDPPRLDAQPHLHFPRQRDASQTPASPPTLLLGCPVRDRQMGGKQNGIAATAVHVAVDLGMARRCG